MSRASARPELRSGFDRSATNRGEPLTAGGQRSWTAVERLQNVVLRLKKPGEKSNNWTYSSPVEDRKALERVKVGDKVDIMWTVALLFSFDVKK